MWDQSWVAGEGDWIHLSDTDVGGNTGGAKVGVPNKELVSYSLEASEGLSASEY